MLSFVSGHRVKKPEAGGPAERSRAASGEQPAGEGSLSQELALAAGAAGQQDLWADGAAGHPGQAPGEQLERPTPSPTAPSAPQPALREENTCMLALTSSPTRRTTWILSFCFSTCIRYVKEYVYTRLYALTVHTLFLRYSLKMSQVKRLCLETMPSLRSTLENSWLSQHVRTLNEYFFLFECLSVFDRT